MPDAMTRIAYVLLCHKHPARVVEQAEMLTQRGDFIAIHVDARMPQDKMAEITDALAGNPRVAFAKRVRCGWGEWSLVQASLNALRLAEARFPEATHFYLISGDCMPTKSVRTMRRFLRETPVDHIEGQDFFESDWIQVGLKEDRLHYRHFFNERERKSLFYASLAAQKALGLARPVPEGLRMRIGSQWWCLRRGTVERVLAFIAKRRDVMRFFRTTWIPDETFFQTIVHHLIPADEIRSRPPTFLLFSDYGMPVNFHGDHYTYLVQQDRMFARKISEHAAPLRDALSKLYLAADVPMPEGPSGGEALYAYVSGRGRIGRRYATRVWEQGSRRGANRALWVYSCKKWHVAKRFARTSGEATGVPAFGYVFGEEDADLPEMGSLERGLPKRLRHRRAFLDQLFQRTGRERLILCLDTAATDVLADLSQGGFALRVVEIQCEFSQSYLLGHAERLGINTLGLNQEALADILATLRANIGHESEEIQALGLEHLGRIREFGGLEEISATLQRVFGLDRDTALTAATQGRFDQFGSAHVQL